MMVTSDPNAAMVRAAAVALGDLREDVLFIGGAVVGLLITDEAAPPVRPTKDVDVLVEVATRGDYYRIDRLLQKRGFETDATVGAPVCRYVREALVLDVMPTDPAVLGFANRWARAAVDHRTRFTLSEDLPIWLISAPYFVATKLEAFESRGGGDLLDSRDIEDIVAVVDGRASLVAEFITSAPDLRMFVAQRLAELGDGFLDAIPAHLPLASAGREEIIRERIEALFAK